MGSPFNPGIITMVGDGHKIKLRANLGQGGVLVGHQQTLNLFSM